LDSKNALPYTPTGRGVQGREAGVAVFAGEGRTGEEEEFWKGKTHEIRMEIEWFSVISFLVPG
jgi:hypothetical protein